MLAAMVNLANGIVSVLVESFSNIGADLNFHQFPRFRENSPPVNDARGTSPKGLGLACVVLLLISMHL